MKRILSILLCIFLVGLGLTVKSQSLVDSLYAELDSDKTIEQKLSEIKKRANRLLYSNPDTTVFFSTYALRMTEVTKNVHDKIFFLALLGDAEFKLSNYTEALNANFEACKLCEKVNDSTELAHIYSSIGSIYRVSNKLDQAEEYFIKSIELRKAVKDSMGLASSYNNIGIIYMLTADYDTGMDYWGKSLSIKLAIGDSIGAATSMNNMAMYYRDVGQTELALDYFHRALDIKRRVNDHSSIALAYLNLGELYIKQGELKKGEDFYLRALEEANISKSKQLISFSHLTLAKMYYTNEEYKKAYDNYLLHSYLQDTIFDEETAKNIEVVESNYQNEKKALQIKNLEKINKAQDEKQQLFFISAGTGAAALLIIIFIIARSYRIKKKDNDIISQQKAIVEEKNREITDSITYARRLQEAILPPDHLIKTYLPDSFVLFKPKDVVSGDFYWLEVMNDHIIFAVADCTGHGVPGAMVSVVCSNALKRSVKEFNISEPAKILDKTRELVIETFEASIENVQDGMDIALCSLNTKTKELHYAGANNPLWVLRKGASDMEEIKADKQPIGVYANASGFTNHSVQLNEGDYLFLFSDGFADQFGGDKGKKLKYRPFRDLLISTIDQGLEKQKDILAQEFEKWRGDMEQVDDVCVIGVKV